MPVQPLKAPLAPNFAIAFNSIPTSNQTTGALLIMPCQDYLAPMEGGDVITCACTAVYEVSSATWYYPTQDATLSPPMVAYFSYIDANQLVLTVYIPNESRTIEHRFEVEQ